MRDIKSVYITFDNPKMNKDKLEYLIGELLWEDSYGVKVMRCKGIFNDTVENKLSMLQGVEDLFEIKAVKGDIVEKGKFLFVVRGKLDEDKLKNDI